MDKDEARGIINQHRKDLAQLSMMMSLSGMAFGAVGEQVEEALGLPPSVLAKALLATKWEVGLTQYLDVLKQALDGTLVIEEDYFDGRSVTIDAE